MDAASFSGGTEFGRSNHSLAFFLGLPGEILLWVPVFGGRGVVLDDGVDDETELMPGVVPTSKKKPRGRESAVPSLRGGVATLSASCVASSPQQLSKLET